MEAGGAGNDGTRRQGAKACNDGAVGNAWDDGPESVRKSPRDIFCCSFFLGAVDETASAKLPRSPGAIVEQMETTGARRTHDCG